MKKIVTQILLITLALSLGGTIAYLGMLHMTSGNKSGDTKALVDTYSKKAEINLSLVEDLLPGADVLMHQYNEYDKPSAGAKAAKVMRVEELNTLVNKKYTGETKEMIDAYQVELENIRDGQVDWGYVYNAEAFIVESGSGDYYFNVITNRNTPSYYETWDYSQDLYIHSYDGNVCREETSWYGEVSKDLLSYVSAEITYDVNGMSYSTVRDGKYEYKMIEIDEDIPYDYDGVNAQGHTYEEVVMIYDKEYKAVVAEYQLHDNAISAFFESTKSAFEYWIFRSES